MKTINVRIKEIRDRLDKSQKDFGSAIGLKPNSISDIETGKNNPSEQTIKAICREYKVNEDWLRYGSGDDDNIFIPEDMQSVLKIGNLVNEKNEFKKFYLNMMMSLPDEYWNFIYAEFKKFDKNRE